MSRIRRKRAKSEALTITVGALTGVVLLVVIASGFRLLKEKPPQSDAVAEKTQFSLTANDSGRTFTYALGAHFSVFLDEAHYPESKLHCSPQGVVVSVKDLGVAPVGLYTTRFTVVAPGTCELKNNDFSVLIVAR